MVLTILILVVLVFAVRRVITDAGNVGAVPDSGPDRQFALHPALAYLHIAPGVIYLLGAPLQLSRAFRERHLTVHRRLGRVLIPMGLAAGVFAIVFGSLYAFGGWAEGSASIAFGLYFVSALLLALRAVRGGWVAVHRRWMIRAFAVAVAVGTIRVFVGILQALQLASVRHSFGIAFWPAFVVNAAAAEIYVRRRRETPRPRRAAT